MHWLRITKYDPLVRNKEGHYTKNEWTSYSDIGKTYDGQLFTFEDYIKVEDAYVDAVHSFMDCVGISELKIVDLENKFDDFDSNYSEHMIAVLNAVENNQIISTATSDVIRLLLRENMWCKLEGEGLSVHFGYDYYMFIGSEKECNEQLDKIREEGLFVESFISPYL